MGFVSGDRTRRRSCLLRGQHNHGRSNRLHQTCGPVNQQRHVCVEKCPLTMRHVAKRNGDSCGESQQSFGGIMTRRPGRNTRSLRTQADHQSRMTSVRGKQNDLHAQWLEGEQVALVSPADQPAQRRARAAELRRSVRKRTWVSTWTSKQLVETRARVKRRRAMECHGGRLMECRDDRKGRARESNVAWQGLEKTTLSTRAARSAQRRVSGAGRPRDHAQANT